MSKYDELKRLAEAQPNKSWSRDERGRMSHSAKQRMYGVYGPQCVSDYEDWGFTREAASFIAAASPAAILELIAENEALRELLDQAAAMIRSADVETGVCCCGSPIETHGFGDGHSPVDQGGYYALGLLARIDAAMQEAAK